MELGRRILGFIDMKSLEMQGRHLVEADRHIADAKGHVARQRRIVQCLEQNGSPHLDHATTMLAVLEETLRLFEAHRGLVLDQIPVALTEIKASPAPLA